MMTAPFCMELAVEETDMKEIHASESLKVGFLLAFTGGLLDAYSYINRGQVFATAETGNIVLMGIHLAQMQWDQVLHYLLPIVAFFVGVLATDQLKKRMGQREHTIHWRQPLLFLECVVVVIVAFLPTGAMDALANSMISFTSGIQVESFRKFRGCGCTTTMCTGNLRSGTEQLFHVMTHQNQEALEKVKVYYGLIGFFILGAICSGLLSMEFQTRTILVACVPLLVACYLMFEGKQK